VTLAWNARILSGYTLLGFGIALLILGAVI
jgi:hypothetical protein